MKGPKREDSKLVRVPEFLPNGKIVTDAPLPVVALLDAGINTVKPIIRRSPGSGPPETQLQASLRRRPFHVRHRRVVRVQFQLDSLDGSEVSALQLIWFFHHANGLPGKFSKYRFQIHNNVLLSHYGPVRLNRLPQRGKLLHQGFYAPDPVDGIVPAADDDQLLVGAHFDGDAAFGLDPSHQAGDIGG